MLGVRTVNVWGNWEHESGEINSILVIGNKEFEPFRENSIWKKTYSSTPNEWKYGCSHSSYSPYGGWCVSLWNAGYLEKCCFLPCSIVIECALKLFIIFVASNWWMEFLYCDDVETLR